MKLQLVPHPLSTVCLFYKWARPNRILHAVTSSDVFRTSLLPEQRLRDSSVRPFKTSLLPGQTQGNYLVTTTDVFRTSLLKGQCHKIFDFRFFSWITFPGYPIGAFSNFDENSQKYSQLKVHHHCRWHSGEWKNSTIRKVLIILFRHLSIVDLTYIKMFSFNLTLRCK